jgi:hypothetical protein
MATKERLAIMAALRRMFRSNGRHAWRNGYVCVARPVLDRNALFG